MSATQQGYENPHVGDVFNIVVEVQQAGAAIDISGVSVKKIRIDRPDDPDTLEKDANFKTDGKDGKIYYQVPASESTKDGTWRAQGKVEWPDGRVRSSRVGLFTVEENL